MAQQPVGPGGRMGAFQALTLGTKILLGTSLFFVIFGYLPWQSVFGFSGDIASGSGGFIGGLAGVFCLLLLLWEALQAGTSNLITTPLPPGQVTVGLAALTILFGLIKFFIVVAKHPGFAAFIGLILLLGMGYGAFLKLSEPGNMPGRRAAGPPAAGGGFSA